MVLEVVNRLFTIVAFVMLVLWAPVTAHCKLEQIPGLEFLHCPSDASSTSDCADDTCASVEYGAYKVQDHQALVPLPPLTVCATLPIPILENSFFQPQATGLPSVAPPELLQGWRFYQRVAIAVRAPSFLG